MAATSTPTTFGAVIVPMAPAYETDGLHPPPALDSPALSPASSRDDMNAEYLEKPAPPHSPFYQHPPSSFEKAQHSRQSSKTNVATFEKDLESGHVTPVSTEEVNPFTRSVTVDRNQECKMWPSRQTLMAEKMAEKRKKRNTASCAGCIAPVKDFWSKFDKRQQLYLKIGIALFFLGVAVAIGVGISKAVHGGYYTASGNEKPVGGNNGSS